MDIVKPMGKITLALSDELQSMVDHEVALGDFESGGAFIESLIRAHHERKLAALIAALEAGEASGISTRSAREIFEATKLRLRCG